MSNYQDALDELKKGGSVQKAQVYAILTLAQAVGRVADEISTLARRVGK